MLLYCPLKHSPQWDNQHGYTRSCWQPAIISAGLFKQQLVHLKSYLFSVLSSQVSLKLQPLVNFGDTEHGALSWWHGPVLTVTVMVVAVDGSWVESFWCFATCVGLFASGCVWMHVWLRTPAVTSPKFQGSAICHMNTHTHTHKYVSFPCKLCKLDSV